jgi:hypothetical protein
MMTKKLAMTIGVAVLALGTAFAVPAQAAGVKVGVLMQRGLRLGYILGSSKDIRCNYVPNSGFGEHYYGNIAKVGVDIGYTKGGVLIWSVIAPSSDLKPGALEGGYGGVSAQATVGVGVGANALIGGFDKSISLQPLSIEGNKGLNVAAGIGALNLKFDKG